MTRLLVLLGLTLTDMHFGAALVWTHVSDTHFGHDVAAPNNATTTALALNIATVALINARASGNDTWPAAVGGGPVLPPRAAVITGDLVDNGMNEPTQWANFTRVYGLTGTDGLLRQPVYEGRGNHDGGNSTEKAPHFVAASIIARNQLRAAIPSFNITGVSASGLHYSWTWAVGPSCNVHFVHLNLYAGNICEGCSPVSCFYGAACYAGWVYPEESYAFLAADLAAHVNTSGMPVVTLTHYGFDGYSNSWYSQQERERLFALLSRYNTIAALVGHTHVASVYSYNGTAQGPFGAGGAFIDVINAPSTQKEDGSGNPSPSEWLVSEVAQDAAAAAAGTAVFRVAQAVGESWGSVLARKTIACAA